MSDKLDHMQKELARLVDRHTDMDGYRATPIPHLGLSRYSAPHYSTLAGKIEFTPSLVLELLTLDELRTISRNTVKRGMYVSELDESMLDAVVRLVSLLNRPSDIPVLAPLYTKEIVYRALHGENGDFLRSILADGGPTFSIKKAMQHNYNLIAREEENEMFPLCADNGIQTLVYSPLARGRLARPWGATSIRSEAEPAAAKLYEATAAADERIIGAIGEAAKERGVSQAVISLAWIYRNPVVAAPLVGALKTGHIDDAIQALQMKLTDEEARRLEAEYTPRVDPMVVNSDPKGIAPSAASVGLNISVPSSSK